MIRYAYAAAAVLLACAPASAAVVTTNVGFTSDSFTRIGTPSSENILEQTPPPFRANAKSIRFTADIDADFELAAIPSLWSFGLNASPYNLRYDYALDRLFISGVVDGETLSQTQTDLFVIMDSVFRGSPTVSLFQISSSNSPGGYWEANYAFAAVPEPASWAMMIGGFGLLGAAVRRKARSDFRLAAHQAC